MKNPKLIEILMVEDNPGDVRLTKEALLEAKVRNNMNVVEDGHEAIEYLHKRGAYETVTTPDIIFLDLNLPKVSGTEVLEHIKTDPALRRIPVVVLTTSQAEQDILASYDRYANAFVTKPVDLEQFITIIKSIEEFWLEIVRLPND